MVAETVSGERLDTRYLFPHVSDNSRAVKSLRLAFNGF